MRANWIRRRFANNHWTGFGTSATEYPHVITMDDATWLFGTTGHIGVALRGDFPDDEPLTPASAEAAARYLARKDGAIRVAVADLKAWAGVGGWRNYREADTEYGSVIGVHINKKVLALLLEGVTDEAVDIAASDYLTLEYYDTLVLYALDDSWRAIVAGVKRQKELPGGTFGASTELSARNG